MEYSGVRAKFLATLTFSSGFLVLPSAASMLLEQAIRRRRFRVPSATCPVHAMGVLVMLLLSLGAPIGARAECGDADGDGNVTVTDGVQALRAAAGLSSICDSACDVDGDGNVTVTDGVNILRKVAGFPIGAEDLDGCGDGGSTPQVAGTWRFQGTLEEVEGCTDPSPEAEFSFVIRQDGRDLQMHLEEVDYTGEVTTNGFFLAAHYDIPGPSGEECTVDPRFDAIGHRGTVQAIAHSAAVCADDGPRCIGTYVGTMHRE